MCLGTAGEVVEVMENAGLVMARVQFPAAPEQLCLSYVEALEPGDRVLVSGGAVVERVTEEEAEERNSLAALLIDALRETTEEANDVIDEPTPAWTGPGGRRGAH
jgi:hydrogenase maturation factor